MHVRFYCHGLLRPCYDYPADPHRTCVLCVYCQAFAFGKGDDIALAYLKELRQNGTDRRTEMDTLISGGFVQYQIMKEAEEAEVCPVPYRIDRVECPLLCQIPPTITVCGRCLPFKSLIRDEESECSPLPSSVYMLLYFHDCFPFVRSTEQRYSSSSAVVAFIFRCSDALWEPFRY